MNSRMTFRWGTAFGIAAFIALLLAPGCTTGQNESPAYQRWGITKPAPEELAEKQMASAYNLLYGMQFRYAEAAYEQIVEKFPNSAEAHLGLSMAYRYSGRLSEAVAECEKALDLDPDAVGAQCDYADLVTPTRGAELTESLTDSARFALSNAYYLKAAGSGHPFSAYAHGGLWANHMALGQLSEARRQLVELGKKKYSPKMLEDFAYNMLVSLEPDAIIFTNGDNDTYPLLTLQEHDNFRQDVTVVNLGLLDLTNVARLLRDSLEVPISYNDDELEAMKPGYDSAQGRLMLPADQLVSNIVKNARHKKRPVYFAVTVTQSRLADYRDNLVLEGLAWKVVDTKARDSVDIAKVIQNMTENYRLDSIGQEQTWSANMSPITRNVSGLAVNYVALYNRMADYYESCEEDSQAVDSYRRMFLTSRSINRTDLMKLALDHWLKLKPDDSEAKALRDKYLKDS